MSRSTSTLLVGQSGGATAVVNASLVGAVDAAVATAAFGRVLGMRGGIEGLLREQFLDLTAQPDGVLDIVRRTPSAALGTGRYKLQDDEFDLAMEVLRRHEIHGVVYIGGNDSADTSHRLHRHAIAANYDLSVMAVPKTVDNDLVGTDHCPGYGSIAKYLANATRDATYDTLAAPHFYPVKFIEVMGRDAGWVAAACGLGFGEGEADLSPLLYFPERPVESSEMILDELHRRVLDAGWVIAVVPETLRDVHDARVGGNTPDYVDQFGHPYYPSPAESLVRLVTEKLGLRSRFDRPGTASRMSISLASEVDLEEAYQLGAEAARRVARGDSDQMTSLVRNKGECYECQVTAVPLSSVANRARTLPDEFIGDDGRSVTAPFRAYALPLLGPDPFPKYGRLNFT